MDRNTLKCELNKIGVTPTEYSLDGELIPNNIILYKNYDKWEVFYLDERGNKNKCKVFTNEAEALNYIFQLFLNLYNLRKKYY